MSLFIVFDGLDGSGKSEMIKRLSEYLKSKKKDVLITKEPTDSECGKEIRHLLENEKDPEINASKCLALFVKDRKQHLTGVIEPALKKGKTVISDRYYYSTIAFQHTQGIDLEQIIIANMAFRTPDITFILDVSPETALGRIGKRGTKTQKFEKKDFMEKLRKNFLKVTEELDENIHMIDASGSKEQVFGQIKKEVDKLL